MALITLGTPITAIDASFVDLQQLVSKKPVPPTSDLRLCSVRVPDFLAPQPFEKMVGAVGFEPTTPTMSL